MFRDALTLWQLEWKRCKWLWIGVIILMAAGQAMLKLPQGNMPGFLKWCPLGLAFLSPLFFSGAIASMLVRNRLPILLTLPVKSRGIYWIYYFGALILCFLFASTLCLTQVFSFVDLLLGVSLLFLIHSVVFWSALLRFLSGSATVADTVGKRGTARVSRIQQFPHMEDGGLVFFDPRHRDGVRNCFHIFRCTPLERKDLQRAEHLS